MELINKEPKIFIFCGKARHGKSSAANYTREYYENLGLKVVEIQYSFYIKEYAKKVSGWDGNDETKPRELLQIIGTDLVRNKIDNLFFIKRITDDIRVYSYFFDVVLISDCRIALEITSLKEAFKNQVKAFSIVRPNFENALSNSEKKHLTETGLDNFTDYDYSISNDGTLDDLKNKVFTILKGENHES